MSTRVGASANEPAVRMHGTSNTATYKKGGLNTRKAIRSGINTQKITTRKNERIQISHGVTPASVENCREQNSNSESGEKKAQFAFTLSQEAQFAMVHGYKDKIMDLITTETPSGEVLNENGGVDIATLHRKKDFSPMSGNSKRRKSLINFTTRPPSPTNLTLVKDSTEVLIFKGPKRRSSCSSIQPFCPKTSTLPKDAINEQSVERRSSCSSIQPFRHKTSTLSKDAINQQSVGRRSSCSSIASHRPKSSWNSEATRTGVVPSAPPPKSGSMYRKLQNLRERALATHPVPQNGESNPGTSSRLTRRRQSLPVKLAPRSQVVTQLLQTEITLMDALKLDKTISAPATARRHSSETFADLISSLTNGMKLLDDRE